MDKSFYLCISIGKRVVSHYKAYSSLFLKSNKYGNLLYKTQYHFKVSVNSIFELLVLEFFQY